MQKINKGNPPSELIKWKKKNPNGVYKDLTEIERQAVRQSCLQEQKYLCAYCCDKICMNTSHNEHIKPKSQYPKLKSNYDNIVASCNFPNHCGHKKGNMDIPLTPLMVECETELQFKWGMVFGTTARAKETIDILGLNETNLTENRRSYVNSLDEVHKQINDGTLSKTEKQELLKDEFQSGPYAPILLKVIDSIV